MTIKNRLIVSFGLLVFLIIGSVSVEILQSSRTRTITDRVIELRAPAELSTEMLLNGINHSLATLRGWMLLRDEKFRQDWKIAWDRDIDRSLADLDRLSKSWINPKNVERLDQVEILIERFRLEQQKIIGMDLTTEFDLALQVLETETAPDAFHIEKILVEMVENQKLLMETDANLVMKIEDQTALINWLLLIFGAVIGITATIISVRSITQPIGKLLTAVSSVEQGILTKADVETSDEIGEFAVAFNSMIDTINTASGRLNAVFTTAVDGIITIDEKGIVESFNPAAEMLFGYTADEMIGENVKMLMPQPFKDEHDQYLSNYHRTGRKKIIGIGREVIGLRKNGSTFPIILTVGEAIVGGKKMYTGMIKEITDQKKLETDLQSARDHLEDQVREQTEEIANANVSLQDQIAEMSEKERQISEQTVQLTAQNWIKSGESDLNDLLSGEMDLQEISKKTITFVANYLNAKVGAIFLNTEDETFKLIASYAYMKRKNLSDQFKIGEGLVGQSALEKSKILISNVPEDYVNITSGTGSAHCTAMVVMPIIHEDEVKGILEFGFFQTPTDLQLEFLDLVAPNIAIAIHMTEARTRMSDLLQQTQQQAEELEAQSVELVASNEELEAQRNELSEQQRDLEIKNSELETAKRNVDRKAEELEQSVKYKSEFLANMSHELRTPLNSILILSEIVKEESHDNLTKKQLESVQTIHRSGSDLLKLINGLLDLSKIEAGKMTLMIEDVSLTDIKDQLYQSLSPAAHQKNISFETDLEDGSPQIIQTDQTRLSQILTNLIGNAIKFTNQGEVRLEIKRATGTRKFDRIASGDEVIGFYVTDTGIGISEDQQREIFEAFQQADGSTSRKFGGTGLGLSIARELTSLLGGEIHLESSEIGKGSTFALYLPFDKSIEIKTEKIREIPLPERLSAEPVPKLSPVEEESDFVSDDRDGISEGDRVLLIVEDDEAISKIFQSEAKNKGYKVLIAMRGDTGIALAHRFKPDAIILDLMLPVMNGWQVLDRLKSYPETRHIPVHIVSALNERRRGLGEGAITYLNKPVNLEDISSIFEVVGRNDKRTKTVLVVEDNADHRESVLKLIGGDDVNLIGVGSGGEALQKLSAEKIDFIVMDFGLPDMNGRDLILQIRENPTLAEIPIIVYTGRDLLGNGKETQTAEQIAISDLTEAIIVKDVNSPKQLLEKISIFLHRTDDQFSEDQRRYLEGSDSAIFSGKKILIADDDMRTVFAITATLDHYQLETVIAGNGKEAVEIIKAQGSEIDLVLMDIVMPIMDGYEAIRQIRQLQHGSLPIIALTAKSMDRDREKCISAGASDYVSKPLNVDQLTSVMKVWLYS